MLPSTISLSLSSTTTPSTTTRFVVLFSQLNQGLLTTASIHCESSDTLNPSPPLSPMLLMLPDAASTTSTTSTMHLQVCRLTATLHTLLVALICEPACLQTCCSLSRHVCMLFDAPTTYLHINPPFHSNNTSSSLMHSANSTCRDQSSPETSENTACKFTILSPFTFAQFHLISPQFTSLSSLHLTSIHPTSLHISITELPSKYHGEPQ